MPRESAVAGSWNGQAGAINKERICEHVGTRRHPPRTVKRSSRARHRHKTRFSGSVAPESHLSLALRYGTRAESDQQEAVAVRSQRDPLTTGCISPRAQRARTSLQNYSSGTAGCAARAMRTCGREPYRRRRRCAKREERPDLPEEALTMIDVSAECQAVLYRNSVRRRPNRPCSPCWCEIARCRSHSGRPPGARR
jgi:hypothetical protein